MNNTDILEEFIPLLEDGYVDNKDCTKEIQAIENLIKENKELKEENDRIGKLYYEANENCIKYEKDYILKSKVEEILDKYKYTEIEDGG